MVTRSAVPRSLIVLWTIWLTAALSNPAALHTCPTHGTPASLLESASRNSAWHAEHAASASLPGGHENASHAGRDHAGRDHAGRDHASGGHENGEHGSSHDCTCLGLCCCDSPVAALVRTPEIPVVPLRMVRQARFRVATRVEAHRRHVQPYANGPPEMGASLA